MSFGDPHDLPYQRLLRLEDDRRIRVLGLLALVTVALPVSLGAEQPLFVWQLLPALGGGDAMRLLAPAILAAGLLLLPFVRAWTRLGLGVAVLALLAGCVVLIAGASLGTRELFGHGLLSFVGRQPVAVIGGFTLVAAGADVLEREGLRTLGRRLIYAGVLLLFLLYVLPQRGRPFMIEVFEQLGAVFSAGSAPLVFNAFVYLLFAFFPLGVGIWALVVAASDSKPGLLGSVSRYGLAGLSIFLSYRLAVGGFGAIAVFVFLRAALLLAVIVGVASRGLEMILVHLLHEPLPPSDERSRLARDRLLRDHLRRFVAAETDEPRPWDTGLPPVSVVARALLARRIGELAEEDVGGGLPPGVLDRDAARRYLARLDGDTEAPDRLGFGGWILAHRARTTAVLLVVVALAGSLVAWRAARPTPDLTWTPSPATKTERRLFAESLPRYVLQATVRNRRLGQGETSAEDAVRMREERREMLQEARDVDPELAAAIEGLLSSLDALDLEGRVFHDRVMRINRAIRRVGLPFWLDTYWAESERDGRTIRYFYLVAYEVERIHRFASDGEPYAALHVRRVDKLSLRGSLLGFVMPGEPFAVVDLDVVDEYVVDRASSLRDGGTCGISGSSETLAGEAIDALCGTMVKRLLAERGVDVDADKDALLRALFELQVTSTEVHEIQHQVDADDVPIPAALYRLAPGTSDPGLFRAARELSAHLSELVSDDPVRALLTLAHLSDFLLAPAFGSRYRYAAGVIVNSLSGEEILSPGYGGQVDAGKLLALWTQVTEQGDGLAAWVGARAAAAREEILGDPPAALTLVD